MTRETALQKVRDMWAAADKRMQPLPGSNVFWLATGMSMGVAIGVLEMYEIVKPCWEEVYQLHRDLQGRFLARYAQ